MVAHLRCCVSLMTALVALAVAAACGSSSPPTPSPGPGNGESITGRERLGWDQPAPDAVELATFRYAIYVDGARSEIADASCATSKGTGGFPCSGRLPTMTNGAHTLELAAFTDTPGTGLVESARSAPLRVTVNGVSASQTSTIADGDLVTTADGLRLRVDVLHDGLVEPSTLAIAGDGRVFVGSRSGEVAIVDGTGSTESLPAGAGAILSIALSPTFARDRFVYLTQADSASGDFRTARYRELRGRLGERMVVLQNGPASAEPAAVLRFGPDARLYAAFDDGDSNDAASRMSEWSGKVLRMEPDGRTPDDQASASPVLWHGLTSPRGFDWMPGASTLWIADTSSDGLERLRVVVSSEERPRRAAPGAAYVLPRGLGVAALAFHGGGAVPQLAGDLFIAGRDGGYILRIRFDDTGRPVTTERLLEGKAGAVRALAMGTDGAIYFCTETLLARLRRVD